jgi:hypothetical protein
MLSLASLIAARAAGKRLGKCFAKPETPKTVTERAISTFIERWK